MGGSGGSLPRRTSRQIESFIDIARERTDASDYEAAVSERLHELLSEYNQRDVDTINDRLEQVKEILADYLESSISLRFGGSVSKHTYVDGISDVDCLLLLRPSEFSTESPQQLLQELERVLRDVLGVQADVKRGALAITLTYDDGMEVQLLPAVPTSAGVRIPTAEGTGWSNVIRPERFANRLTDVNQRLQGRVIPVIKLVKAAISNLGLHPKLEGYHIEALAVSILQNYQGRLNPKAMVQHFFDRASDLVRTPIRDLTEQSVYVDDYLGSQGSTERGQIAQALRGVSQRMAEADASHSEEDWLLSIDAL